MTKEKRIEDLRVLLERRTKFFTKDKNIKVRILQKKILVLNESGESILRKGPYIIDLKSVGWTGKYRQRYEELVGLVEGILIYLRIKRWMEYIHRFILFYLPIIFILFYLT